MTRQSVTNGYIINTASISAVKIVLPNPLKHMSCLCNVEQPRLLVLVLVLVLTRVLLHSQTAALLHFDVALYVGRAHRQSGAPDASLRPTVYALIIL